MDKVAAAKAFGMRDAHVFDVRVEKSVSIVSHLGVEVLRTKTGAVYAAARWLLDNGLALPEHRVVTMIGGVPSLSGYVGMAARWQVTEEDRDGLRLVPFDEVSIKRRKLVDA